MRLLFTSDGQSIGISPSNEYSGLISFRTDWFDLLAVLPVGIVLGLGCHPQDNSMILSLGALLDLDVGTLFDFLQGPTKVFLFYVLMYSVSSHGQVCPMRSRILNFVQIISPQPKAGLPTEAIQSTICCLCKYLNSEHWEEWGCLAEGGLEEQEASPSVWDP